METIIGINEARPRLSSLIDSDRPVIITVNSEPKSVLVNYEEYLRLKNADKYNKQLILKSSLNKFRVRAKESGLTEKDVEEEIDAFRTY
ncbi:hypothetical protein DCCM_4805 [Desulfocucumis palustris]|uniref:Antitoxin n=1 Tax=Desulfocucumis palustris TaxID=1898651 RepID=A0A2L2XMV0_9FIRM|nr:type II toxin-antitoxin system Phd/YefM family antitoxin [Desulfocucumis palustris]GBF35676.1 hypothetical protein DCCM_4805 [Desulfocucumis palustris]